MGSQFIHADSYGRQAGKGKRSGNTIDSIAGEAERSRDSVTTSRTLKSRSSFLASPSAKQGRKPKNGLKGMKDARGHALRKDALCMVAGVVSVPDDLKDWDAYKADALKWLKAKYMANA